MIVAIDFGAATTKTAVLSSGGATSLIEVDGSVEFPSAIYLALDGTFEVGHRATALQARDPLRFDARLKQRVNRKGSAKPRQ